MFVCRGNACERCPPDVTVWVGVGADIIRPRWLVSSWPMRPAPYFLMAQKIGKKTPLCPRHTPTRPFTITHSPPKPSASRSLGSYICDGALFMRTSDGRPYQCVRLFVENGDGCGKPTAFGGRFGVFLTQNSRQVVPTVIPLVENLVENVENPHFAPPCPTTPPLYPAN